MDDQYFITMLIDAIDQEDMSVILTLIADYLTSNALTIEDISDE